MTSIGSSRPRVSRWPKTSAEIIPEIPEAAKATPTHSSPWSRTSRTMSGRMIVIAPQHRLMIDIEKPSPRIVRLFHE